MTRKRFPIAAIIQIAVIAISICSVAWYFHAWRDCAARGGEFAKSWTGFYHCYTGRVTP